MAYQTGVVNDASALRDALTTFAVANGWAWDATNQVLNKGASFVQLTVPSSGELRIQGGTGVDGGGALTGVCGGYARIADVTKKAITWPVAYYAHEHGDGITLFINHDVTYWQWMMFGIATPLGIGGTGAWFAASVKQGVATEMAIFIPNFGYSTSPAVPAGTTENATIQNGVPSSNTFVHTLLDTTIWDGGDGSFRARSDFPTAPLYNRMPNAWNGEIALLPFRLGTLRAGGSFYSPIVELPHIRLTRNDNYDDGAVITLGTDKWKLYPGRAKNIAQRNGADADHSGTFAIAVRYDGP